MKHLINILYIIILTLFPLVAIAQEADPVTEKLKRQEKERQEAAKDPKAMALLDKATAAFDSKKGILADFVITLENIRNDKKESIPGKIWLKGEKFKLSIKDVDTYFDGKTQSVYMKDAQEATISTPDAEELKEINPVMLLKSYKKGYKMSFAESVQEAGKHIDVIDLYPEDLKSANSRISVSIEKESMRLHSVRVQGKDGINTLLVIKKYDYTPLSDEIFIFKPEEIKGIEVIDLR